MAKLLSPKDRPTFTPPDQFGRPQAERIAYAFKVPSVTDQARFNHAVRKAGGRNWGLSQLLTAMADGVRHLLPDEDDAERVAILAELKQMREDILARSQEVGAATEAGADEEEQGRALLALAAALENPRVDEIRTILEPVYPRLREMMADNEVYAQIRGTEAARMFLVDWTGHPDRPRRGVAGVADDSLRRIPLMHRIQIGAFVETLFGPTEQEEKNFSSPSGGGSAGTPSTAESTTIPATLSTATSGSPTSSDSPPESIPST